MSLSFSGLTDGAVSFSGLIIVYRIIGAAPVSVLRFCTLGATRFLRDSGSSIGASLLHKSSSSCLILPPLAFAREERLASDDIESRWLGRERRPQISGTPLRTLNDMSETSGIVIVHRRWELDSLRLSLRAASFDAPVFPNVFIVPRGLYLGMYDGRRVAELRLSFVNAGAEALHS